MSATYGELIDKMVDRMARYEDRAGIFRVVGILKGNYYNVINPNKETASGNKYTTAIEWLVGLTNHSARNRKNGVPGDYEVLKQVNKDCGCICLTPEDQDTIKTLLTESIPDPLSILSVLQKIMGEK
jgi:hypothetical protein